MAAIDQRRKDPVNGDEGLALAEAETGLQILISEAIARCDWVSGHVSSDYLILLELYLTISD
jgi:hypothetical protein